MPDDRFDVFLSYARADAGEWADVLAGNLERLGFHVFYDRWEVGAGDVLVHELDRGLLNSAAGVLVVTPAALASAWVQQEYAAMMTRAVAGEQRLIPVLFRDAEMPPLLASRVWVDFRGADGPVYERRVEELAAALRGEKGARPPRGEALAAPPGTGFRAAGPIRRTLRLGTKEVRWSGGPQEMRAEPRGLGPAEEEDLWLLARARRRAGSGAPVREAAQLGTAPAVVELHASLLEVGGSLTRAFLPGAVGAAVRAAVEEATNQGASLEIAVEVQEETQEETQEEIKPEDDGVLASLPWETLRVPAGGEGSTAAVMGPPLVLHPNVELYRALSGLGPSPAVQVPGPLRVLVAIGSPETAGGGELLDYEAELGRILEAVEPARRAGKAYVKILHRGTVAAIRAALAERRYHVLYVSCHAGPGVLVLEDEEGRADRVDSARLWQEGLPKDRQPPLVVLAGCGTALGGALGVPGAPAGLEAAQDLGDPEPAGEAPPERAPASHLPGLAEGLLRQGVPAVVAMQAPVTDVYARRLGAALFGVLAASEEPFPLRALAEARRRLEAERRKEEKEALRRLAEWATPSLYLRGAPLPLYDPGEAAEVLGEAPEPHLADGVVVRRAGDFVGRRREERLALRAFRDPDLGGVLIHGLGGVGKSTLAAQLVHRLAEAGWPRISVAGETSPDGIFEALGQELVSQAVAQGLDEKHPRRQLAAVLRRPDLDWQDRFEVLSGSLLASTPLLVLLDNFEDNLAPAEIGYELKDPGLAALLARWARNPGKSRLLVTCRYPVPLPDEAQRRLAAFHLGPLSFAETRKLLWRLPALDALEPGEKLRAYTDVGGHPRALEYLDALLRGGEARFPDVAENLEQALRAREGIEHPAEWLAGVAGDLDRALAETVTLAVDDVLLGELLDRLEGRPFARELLLGASVYRLPVDDVGLVWQVGEVRETDPELRERVRDYFERHREVRREKQDPSPEALGYDGPGWQRLQADLEAWQTPPVEAPEGLAEAVRALLDLGLLSPLAQGGGGAPLGRPPLDRPSPGGARGPGSRARGAPPRRRVLALPGRANPPEPGGRPRSALRGPVPPSPGWGARPGAGHHRRHRRAPGSSGGLLPGRAALPGDPLVGSEELERGGRILPPARDRGPKARLVRGGARRVSEIVGDFRGAGEPGGDG